MNKLAILVDRTKLGFGLALLVVLTGCYGYVDGGPGVVVGGPDVVVGTPGIWVGGVWEGGYAGRGDAHRYSGRGGASRAVAHGGGGGRGGGRR